MGLILCVAQMLCVRRIPLEILILSTDHRPQDTSWKTGANLWVVMCGHLRMVLILCVSPTFFLRRIPLEILFLNTNQRTPDEKHILLFDFLCVGTYACFWLLSDTDDFPLQDCIDLDPPPMLPLVQGQFSALQLWRFQANVNNLAESSIWHSQIEFTCIPVRLLQSDCS